MTAKVDRNWWTLRIALGTLAIVAGLDKFTHVLVDWTRYLAPAFRAIIPVDPLTFFLIVGVIEVVVGIGIFTPWTQVFAYAMSGWVLLIAINLVVLGAYDIAARDVAIAVAAFVLGSLSTSPALETRTRRTLRAAD